MPLGLPRFADGRLLATLVVSVGIMLFPALPMDPSALAEDGDESIQVWVRDAEDKAPVVGVEVLVTGGGFEATEVTGDDGKVLVGLPGPGEYTVALIDLTDETGYPAAGLNPRTIAVSAGNVALPANFLLTPDGVAVAVQQPGFLETLLPYVVTGLVFGLLLSLAAIGLSLIYGTTGLSNFAHGEMVTFGALVGYLLTAVVGLPVWIAAPGVILLGALLGYGQNLLIWKPLRRRGVGLIAAMIVSIGLSLVFKYALVLFFGPDRLILPNDNAPFLVIGPLSLRLSDVLSAGACLVILLLIGVALVFTRIGRATRAVADNKPLAAASGINVESISMLVWVVGGGLAGLSGLLLGYYQTTRWDMGSSILLLMFAAVILGGLGTIYGALIGALVIGVALNVSTIWLPENMKYASALAIMILILLVRPRGLLGKSERVG